MKFYKGKTSITELGEMPNRMMHTLYINMVEQLSTDEGIKEAAAEKLHETLGGGI